MGWFGKKFQVTLFKYCKNMCELKKYFENTCCDV